ncbi:PR domain zinc finger protein 13 [Belonocnema kinseyi]|uniref:PR domain zinc finger protein 13 n=1 Tax=Belonocnema kinseyi TaxID=2817044 RepID=UPI00143DF957|nr:PR domain zinc finger protein 13 [Belonocnema kinseyi]
MLDTMICHRNLHSLIPENSLIVSRNNLNFLKQPYGGGEQPPVVRAATQLRRDSSTAIVDVQSIYNQSQKQFIKSVNVTESDGLLRSCERVETSWWITIVSIAKDCQSSNVILNYSEKGVYLKTIKIIAPGEPLLMWFTEKILALMNIPFLLPKHIQGQNRYTCDICHFDFEFPNPLKLHLALRCNHFDQNYLWAKLARDFETFQPRLSLNLFPPLPPFKFELSASPTSPQISPTESYARYPTETFPMRTPPTMTEILNNSANISSPTPSQGSPQSGNETSPVLDYSHRKSLGNHHSAFKPYSNQPIIQPTHVAERKDLIMNSYEGIQGPALTPIPSMTVNQAAHIEAVYSNLGKTKKGHRCGFCGKVYSRKYGLKIHIRTHTGYKPLQCYVCHRPFGDPSNLNKHVRLHADVDRETPYRCNICGKVLVRRRDLERHIKSRHQRENSSHLSETSSDDLDV